MTSHWPHDADGDVLRRLLKSDFDFHAEHSIDFNVDFNIWPPSPAFVKGLRTSYPDARLIEPDDTYAGYVTFVVKGRVTYELVVFVQQSVSELAKPFGGVCESWGVAHEPG